MKMFTTPPQAENDLSATPAASPLRRAPSHPATIPTPDPDSGVAARREEFRLLLRRLPTDQLQNFVAAARAITRDATRTAAGAGTPEMTA